MRNVLEKRGREKEKGKERQKWGDIKELYYFVEVGLPSKMTEFFKIIINKF